MNTRTWKNMRSGLVRRILSLTLAAVMLCGLLPGLPAPEAEAAEWMEPYLETLTDWGVMRGSSAGDLNPDRVLTRAEFVTMINRAFGYTERGTTPFRDVPENAWYADDINIAYQAGYFQGTSENTATPLGRVTREQAAVLLGRNLRMQGVPGVNSDFSDYREMGNWSRGLVQECAERGIIQGYADGTFRPKNYITRGQMACFLVRALGTLVSEPGERIAGGVYGNLTINSPDVKLKDTVVTGNLYLTGGVGLGGVELENVTVMGKIIVCGAGEAEKGKDSIVLRNVTAEGLEIDSLADNFMSVRSEGLTNIAETTVRTSAYLEDVTEDGQGLRLITLDGADGTQLQLAGNIKEVVNITPNSDLQVVQGVSDTLTVDERAVGSSLSIANDTTVRVLNLDTATPVTGNGDVSHMSVNAAGSTATMLPDTIFVRPGINSNIHGQVMDNVAAEESSDEPRLLSGYPLARNVASTSADGVFSTNKRGTLYWAVSTLLDGSAGEEELRSPAAYPGKILRSGTINVTSSKTEMTARITGLSKEGSYYISAMLVDERGHASPVKVTAFTTTDDSAPAFATGYPEAVLYVSPEEEQIIQARVMATKTCRLYYALLPQNASAPSAADMRSGAVTGNLGYGTMEVRKNTAYTIPKVNSAYLQEKTTYSLYLWLNDADNGKSSAVRRLQVTTKDVTPPIIERLEATDMKATSITMTYSLNEPGTLYWAIVKKGTTFYSKDIEEVGTPPSQANNDLAKMQIKRGLGVKRGSSTASREATDVNFTITGLEPQTAYDLYYVAEDRDGNFNVYTTSLTPPMQVNTLDELGPTVKQEFTHDGSDGNTQHPTPYTDTSIRLIFSEEVQGIDSSSQQEPSNFLSLYNEGKFELLAAALEKHVRLYYTSEMDEDIQLTAEKKSYGWIDYKKARVEPDASGSGELIITFPQEKEGLGLASGATYYFELEGIYDTAAPQYNQLQNTTRGILKLPEFTTLFATVNLTATSQRVIKVDGADVSVTRSFSATPTGTETVSEDTYWDMLFWTDTSMSYTLYVRERGKDAGGNWESWPENAWKKAGYNSTVNINVMGAPEGRVYASLSGYVNKDPSSTVSSIPKLREFDKQYEFAIKVESVDAPADAEDITMEIVVLAGNLNAIEGVAGGADHGWKQQADRALADGAVAIHNPNPFKITIPIPGRAPQITAPYPILTVGDISGSIQVTLDRSGTVYYLAVPVEGAETAEILDNSSGEVTGYYAKGTDYTCDVTPQMRNTAGNLEKIDLENVPLNGRDERLDEDARKLAVDSPTTTRVSTKLTGDGIAWGSLTMEGEVGRTLPAMTGLLPQHHYVLYLVTVDGKGVWCDKAWCYQFYTDEAHLPIISVAQQDSENATIQVNRAADLSYVLIPTAVLFTNDNTYHLDWPFTSADPYKTANDSWTDNSVFNGVTVKTVLDAMLTTIDRDGRSSSVFDTYGSTEAKSQYSDIIRGMGSMSGTGSSNTDPALRVPLERFEEGRTGIRLEDGWLKKDVNMPADKMIAPEYTLLVVGHSVNSDKRNDAFRASQTYRKRDDSLLTVIDTEIYETGGSGAETFTGEVYVTFNNPLYYKGGSDLSFHPVDDCGKDDTEHDSTSHLSDNNYINVAAIMSTRPSTQLENVEVISTGGHDNAAYRLGFDVSGLSSGNAIVLNRSLSGPNYYLGNRTSDLTLTLNRVLISPYVPGVPGTSGSPGGILTDTNGDPVYDKDGKPIVVPPSDPVPEVPEQPAVYEWQVKVSPDYWLE